MYLRLKEKGRGLRIFRAQLTRLFINLLDNQRRGQAGRTDRQVCRLRQVAEEIKRSVRQTVEAQTQVPPVAPQEPVIPPAPKEPKPRFGDINQEYVPPPPSMSISDAPNPDNMIAKATKGQLERMKNDLYERVNSEGTRSVQRRLIGYGR
jgi:hypothetical protein